MIILGFNGNLNASIDVGDAVYFVYPSSVGTNTDNSSQFSTATITDEPDISNPVILGTVSSIQTNDVLSSYYTDQELSVVSNAGTVDESTTVVNTIINVQEDGPTITPLSNAFYFFSKNNRYNMSSLTGYYGDVKFNNNSTEKAELFSTACEIIESSK